MTSSGQKCSKEGCGRWCSLRCSWSGCLSSCTRCSPFYNNEEPFDVQQTQTPGHVEEAPNDSQAGEASQIDSQIRQFMSKEQQLPPMSLKDLDNLLNLVTAQVKRLMSSGSEPNDNALLIWTVSQYAERKEVLNSLIQSLPSDLIKKVVGGSEEVLMPLLTKALGGMGNLQWVGLGLRLIAWSLDNMHNTMQNSEECLEILQDVLDLMKKTKQIWEQASNNPKDTTNPDLQKIIEIAFRCAIICTINVNNPALLRFFDAQRVTGTIANLKQELRDAKISTLLYTTGEILRVVHIVDKQTSFVRNCDNDRVGGDEEISIAKEYLKKDCNDMSAVCLHGMGGIGKSFIALEIFKIFQTSRSLEQESPFRPCRVRLELGINDEKLVDIQKRILRTLFGPDASNNVFDCDEGKEKLTKELKKINDPIFLYLDNVLEDRHLEIILPEASCFPSGSKLLVTSRGANIEMSIKRLGIKDVKPIEIKHMQDKEAKELLWKQINRGEDCKEVSNRGPPQELVERVIKLCGGLPLALKVVGGYIGSDKKGPSDARVWEYVVDAMQKAEPLSGSETHDPLYSGISFSIHSLRPSLKSAFLDIVSFYGTGFSFHDTRTEWKDIKCLVRHRDHLKILQQRALLQKIQKSGPSDAASRIEIHDVVYALARRMINDDTHELRIKGTDSFKKLDSGILEKVVALQRVTLKASVLPQMPHLRILKWVEVEGECEEAVQLHDLSLVDGLTSSSAKLFDLEANECLKYVSWRCAGENDLEFLRREKTAKALQFLLLWGWEQLKNVDVLGTLRCLKELELIHCPEISHLPEGIGSLTNLKRLRLYSCDSLRTLPAGLTSLTRLAMLDLECCSSLQELPKGIGSLTSLTYLSLFGCTALQHLPDGITGLTSLIALNLSECRSLECLPDGVEGLKSLSELQLRSCRSLKFLPRCLACMSSLVKLDLYLCTSLQCLPKERACLTCLARLEPLSGGDSLQSNMEPAVLRLNLSFCTTLETIEAVPMLTRLTELNLSRCERLQMLPEGFSRLTRLTSLDLSYTSVKSLQEIKSLTSIQSLGIYRCEGLYSLMEEGAFSLLGKVTDVEVSWCRCLQYAPESLTSFTRLTYLSLEGCGNTLPEELTSLTGLERLTLTKCESVQSLPQGFTSLTGKIVEACSLYKK